MLTIGTVFSGIGAAEHALERLGIEYKIAFACDNGDVDILSKPVLENITAIKDELQSMQDIDPIYKKDIEGAQQDLKKLLNDIKQIIIDYTHIYAVYSHYILTGKANKNQEKAYSDFINIIEGAQNIEDKYVAQIKFSIKLESDIKRSSLNANQIQQLILPISDFNVAYRKVAKALKSLTEKLSMLHERINTESIRAEIFKMDSLSQQKAYVDNLYAKYNSQNKVKESYLANYNIEEDDFHWNVSFFDGRHFYNKIDLFVGGSPCQSFSLVGKQRGLDDTRGTLFYEYARLVKEIQPKIFIYENVKAILSNDNGETWKTITKIFEDLGYDWQYQILNAKDYGIPQNRERVFVVGFRKDLCVKNFKFPEKLPLEKKMKDFLLDNVSGKYYLPKKGVAFVTSDKNLGKRYTQIDGDIQLCQKKNQQFNWHGDFVFEEEMHDKQKLMEDLEKYFLSEKVKKYVLSSGTKGFYSKPKIDLEIARPLLQSMHKMHRAGVDNYVTTEGRLRKLTPRECLRLMGFCDSFKIVVSDTAAYQQSGNSIVVDVLMQILKEIDKVYSLR